MQDDPQTNPSFKLPEAPRGTASQDGSAERGAKTMTKAELAEALFGAPKLPFSVSLEFPRFDGPDYARALEMARAAAEYRETGSGLALRHRARFYPEDAIKLRDLFEMVGRLDASEVLIDDRPVPYARELWLPLMWFLIR